MLARKFNAMDIARWLIALFVMSMLASCISMPGTISTSDADVIEGGRKSRELENKSSSSSVSIEKKVSSQDKQTTKVPARLVEEYRIGVDDIVQISVWRNPALSVTVPVRPDGMISLPLVGDVRAGGLTPNQVSKSVRKKLSRFVRDPQVAVILTELRSHEYLSRIRVTGAVRNPMSMPFRQGMTVLDVVLAAGGTNEFAAPNRSKLYRRREGKTAKFSIRLGDILNKGKLSTNLAIEPGDVITIPERLF